MDVVLVVYMALFSLSLCLFLRHPILCAIRNNKGLHEPPPKDDRDGDDKGSREGKARDRKRRRGKKRVSPTGNRCKTGHVCDGASDAGTNSHRRLRRSGTSRSSRRVASATAVMSPKRDRIGRDIANGVNGTDALCSAEERRRILKSRSSKMEHLIGILNCSVSGVTWKMLKVDVRRGMTYDLLLGIPHRLNPESTNASRDTDSIPADDVKGHVGKRCILLDVRTQATMISCVEEGKRMVEDINISVGRIFRIARQKLWEPIVFTYETTTRVQVEMLRKLNKHLLPDVEETWKSMLLTVRGVDADRTSDVRVYDPILQVVVSDSTTSYREALCRDSVKTVYGRGIRVVTLELGYPLTFAFIL